MYDICVLFSILCGQAVSEKFSVAGNGTFVVGRSHERKEEAEDAGFVPTDAKPLGKKRQFLVTGVAN